MSFPTHVLMMSQMPTAESLSGVSGVTGSISCSSGQTSDVLMLSMQNLDMQSLKDGFQSFSISMKNLDNLERLSFEKSNMFHTADLSSKLCMPSTLPLKKRFSSMEDVNSNNLPNNCNDQVREEPATKKLKFDYITQAYEVVPSNDNSEKLCYGSPFTLKLSFLANIAAIYDKRTVVIAENLFGNPSSDVHDEINQHSSEDNSVTNMACGSQAASIDVNLAPIEAQSKPLAAEPAVVPPVEFAVVPHQIAIVDESSEESSAISLNDSVEVSPDGSDAEVLTPKRSRRTRSKFIPEDCNNASIEDVDEEESDASEEDDAPEPSDEEYSGEEDAKSDVPAASRSPSRRLAGSRARIAKVLRGDKKHERLSKAQAAILREWLFDHKDHPFPNRKQKVELCEQAACEMKQLTNWFYNARKTMFPKRPKKLHN